MGKYGLCTHEQHNGYVWNIYLSQLHNTMTQCVSMEYLPINTTQHHNTMSKYGISTYHNYTTT